MSSTLVDCPQCGTQGSVDFARRDANDFCRVCDYPLFWGRERVISPIGESSGDGGLRRLPGTVGHASLAALACPECAEPNQPSAEYCVRCGAPMHPVVVVAPEPEPLPKPEPLPEPEPEPRPTPWWMWWWPIIAAGVVALIVLVVLLIIYS